VITSVEAFERCQSMSMSYEANAVCLLTPIASACRDCCRGAKGGCPVRWWLWTEALPMTAVSSER
jgi:hypothetical protein